MTGEIRKFKVVPAWGRDGSFNVCGGTANRIDVECLMVFSCLFFNSSSSAVQLSVLADN